MPRDTGGTHSFSSLVRGTAGQVYTAAMVNGAQDDISTELTNSLPRDGRAPMTGQFQGIAGTQSLPGMAFSASPSTGWWWDSVNSRACLSIAGTLRLSVGATGIVAGIPDGDKGDITITSGVWTIDDKAVTLAKIQDLTAKRLLGRGTNSTGAPEQISLDSTLSLSDAGVLGAVIPATVVPTRSQSVNAGPVDTNGLPTLFPATAGSLSLTTQNVSSTVPLVLAAKQGINFRMATLTANQTWGSLANNTTNYLYAEIAADGTVTLGSTTSTPVYQWGGSPSATSGQHTYNIAEGAMYAGDGSAANKKWRVFVGEAVCSGGSVTSTVAYAYNGRYRGQAAVDVGGTPTLFNHNIGLTPSRLDLQLLNISNDAFYNPGQVAYPVNDNASNNQLLPLANNSRNQAQATWSSYLVAGRQINGTLQVLDRTKWNWVLTADRGWD